MYLSFLGIVIVNTLDSTEKKLVYTARRVFSVGSSVHDFLPAVSTIAACEEPRVAGLHRLGINP